MFTLMFILILVGTTYLTNMKYKLDKSDNKMELNKCDSSILLLVFVLTIVLNYFIPRLLPKLYYTLVFISILPMMILFMYLNKKRQELIEQKINNTKLIYNACGQMIGKFDEDNIDLSNLPFEFELNQQKHSVSKIVFDLTDQRVKSQTNYYYIGQQLNEVFPDFQWIGEENLKDQTVTFQSYNKPPQIAMFPGDDYRASTCVPIGVGAKGEICWYITKDSRGMGFSEFIQEDGTYAKTVPVATAPQMLVAGSTGGGKRIYENQSVIIQKRKK